MAPRPELRLVAPTASCRETFLSALAAHQAEGLPWWFGGDLEIAVRDFPAFVAKKLADASPAAGTQVPATHLWALSDAFGEKDQFVGRISIRHALDEELRRMGGHIGYDTVPAVRGRGVAKEMLRQALPIARGLGLHEVLLTCNDDNAASIRVIEDSGGVLRETRQLGPEGPSKRYYWIALVKR